MLKNMIIRCPDLQMIEPLFAYLSAEGVTWGKLKTPLELINIDFQAYAARKYNVLCFCLEGGRLQYCREQWYRKNQPYCWYPFVNAEELLESFAEEESITGLTALL